MGSSCSVCLHPDRAAIDKAMMAHEELRSIADRHALSKSSVHRHRRHIGKAIVRAAARREERFEDNLLGDARDLRGRTLALLDDAVAAKDGRAQVVLLGEIRQNIKLLTELTATPKTTEADTQRVLEWMAVELDMSVEELRHECEKQAQTSADIIAGRHVPHTPKELPGGREHYLEESRKAAERGSASIGTLPAAPPHVVPLATPQSEAEAEDGQSAVADLPETPLSDPGSGLDSGDRNLKPPLPGPWHLTI